MIRLLGAIMIFFACSAAGFFCSSTYRRRARQLEAFTALISHIGAEIDSFLAPLDTIYASFDNRTLEECSFMTALRENGGVVAMQICRRSLSLTDSERAELERFFSGLGHHAAGGEAKHCAYFEKRIGELADTARSEYASKGRVCRTLGMLFGIMLTLVLL